jgi:hypothetical protein
MNKAESHSGTEVVTLRDLFDLTEANFAGAATAAILATQTLAPLELQLLKEMKYFPWKSFAASLGRHALELFRTHLSDILLGAWQKYHVLSEYADSSKHPPGELASVPVFEHTVKSEHHPHLEIRFREQTYEIVFDVELELTLKELILQVQDARIKAIQSGVVEGSGTISLGPAELVKAPFKPRPLPGILRLGEGVSI